MGMLLFAAVVYAAEPHVEVEVDGLGIDAESGSPVVRLVEKQARDGAARRELPIWTRIVRYALPAWPAGGTAVAAA